MLMTNTNTAPKFSQARLDRQLAGVQARAAARIEVAAEMGLSAYHREVVREAHRRARAAR
jgi:hypothetical protein